MKGLLHDAGAWFAGLKTSVQIALIVAVVVVIFLGLFYGVDWPGIVGAVQ